MLEQNKCPILHVEDTLDLDVEVVVYHDLNTKKLLDVHADNLLQQVIKLETNYLKTIHF